MKTILVPTDFSECAGHALEYACRIAEKVNAKIVLLHVLSPQEMDSPTDGELIWMGSWAGEQTDAEVPAMMRLLKLTKQKMSQLMDLPHCNKIQVMDSIEIGRMSRMVQTAAEKYHADLIVMGTHGTSGLNELFIGSNAGHVASDARVPVLSVREEYRNFDIRRIVFATDFSEEMERAFPFVKSFADIFHAAVHLVTVTADTGLRRRAEIDRKFQAFKDKLGGEDLTLDVYVHDSKETGILHAAKAVHADLLALGTHGRRGLARFFGGSVAGGLVNHSSIPVLTVNLHREQPEGMARRQKDSNAAEKLEKNRTSETVISGHVPSV